MTSELKRAGPGPAWVFQSAGEVVFGAGSVRRTGELCARLGARHALLVTDPNLELAGARVRDSLAAHGVACTVFAGGEAEPSVAVAERAGAAGRGRGVDAVIGLGGGSNLDVAKAAAALLAHDGRIADWAGQARLPGPVLPLLALPTTAGSGSEVSGACILAVPEDGTKLAVVDNRLRPRVALVDPELHVTCPPVVTRDAGLDALCHAVEAYTIADAERFPRDPSVPWPLYQGKHPVADALAERAIELIATHLPRALERPADLAARTGMAVGALLAGMAMSNTGIYTVHALTYPVGAETGASHGACNGVLLPPVLDFVERVRAPEARRIAALLGSQRERVGDAVRDFLRRVGAPASLAELGFPRERIEAAADVAHGIRRLMDGSPRPTSRDELVAILRSAYEGEA